MRAAGFKIALSVIALTASGMSIAIAAPSDPAIEQVTALDSALLNAMKGVQDRHAQLTSAIDKTFHFPSMAQFIVGPGWTKFTPDERASVQASLRKYTIARFADEFDKFSGETFTIEPDPKVRGADKLVKTVIKDSKGEIDRVDYRMRQYGDIWKIIDVYYNGVSDLATQRANLGATIPKGAAAISAKIDGATSQIN